MYKAVKKAKVIQRYMEASAIHTGALTVHQEDNTSCISAVEAKRVTPRVKHIDMTVCFLQDQFDTCFLITEYEKSSVMPADMCTKPCLGPITIRNTKCMTGFRFYPSSDT